MPAEAMSTKPHQSKFQIVEDVGILLLMSGYAGGLTFALAGNFWGMSPLERVTAIIPLLLFKIPDWVRDKLRERRGVSKLGVEYQERNWPIESSSWSIQNRLDLDFTDFANFAGLIVTWVLTWMERFDPRLVVMNGILTAAMIMIYLPKPRAVPYVLATDGEEVHLVAWAIALDFALRDLHRAKLDATTYSQTGLANVKVELWVAEEDNPIAFECYDTAAATVRDLDVLLSGWFEQRTLNA